MSTKARSVYRLELLHKDPHCTYCGRKLGVENSNLDHKKPQAKGGKHNRENLVLSCKKCNSIKGSLTNEEWHSILPLMRRDGVFKMTKRQRRRWRESLPSPLRELVCPGFQGVA